MTTETPTVASLTQPPSIKCLDNECGSVFTNKGNFYMHMLKHHNVTIKSNRMQSMRFFCPETKCKYNALVNKETKYFLTKNLLRQHYMKVHAEKTIKCPTCDKLFSSETLKNMHERSCGQTFKCPDCGWTYNSKEALLTHCRRKAHNFQKIIPVEIEDAPQSMKLLKKFVKIAPKTAAIGKVKLPNKLKKSTTTQTSKLCPTIDNTKDTKNGTIFLDTWNKRINEPIGQTKCGKTSSQIDLFDAECSNVLTNDSMSQTDKNLNKINYVEDDSLNCFGVDLCHIETQTEFESIFKENMAGTTDDPMLFTHMHTQTCDDILSELGLIDIQTQTNWPTSEVGEMFVSTETQTSFSSQFLAGNISTHTQTMGGNQQIRDAENSSNSSSSQSTYTQTTFGSCLSDMKLK